MIFNNPPPPPPEIRKNCILTQSELDAADHALSDILCWMDGFLAAGGKYGPETLEELRTLRTRLHRAYHTI